eukprot:7217955-Prymnesium_polylepis.3
MAIPGCSGQESTTRQSRHHLSEEEPRISATARHSCEAYPEQSWSRRCAAGPETGMRCGGRHSWPSVTLLDSRSAVIARAPGA